MTTAPEAGRTTRSRNAIEAVAGLLAAASIAIGAVGVAYRPARLTPVALVIALIAVVMGGRSATLARWATLLAGVFWFAGMIVAVVTKHPVY